MLIIFRAGREDLSLDTGQVLPFPDTIATFTTAGPLRAVQLPVGLR